MQRIVLVELYFFTFFVLFWTLLMMLISKFGGWSRLASVYRAGSVPEGTVFRFQSGNFGFANYNGCITYRVNAEGVHISVFYPFSSGHPPLFIPWRDILNREEKKVFWYTFMKVDIGRPKLATAYFPMKIFKEQGNSTNTGRER